MNRREMLVNMGTLAAAVSVGASQVAHATQGAGHDGHGSRKNQPLIDSAMDCVQRGKECVQHLIENFGDANLRDCAKSVSELVAACGFLAEVAIYDSERLKKAAALAIDVCNSCEAECRKHEKKHQPCKDCADACVKCVEECKKIMA